MENAVTSPEVNQAQNQGEKQEVPTSVTAPQALETAKPSLKDRLMSMLGRKPQEQPYLTPRPTHSEESEGHFKIDREQVRANRTQTPQETPSQ